MDETDVNEEEPVVCVRIDNRLFRFLVTLIMVKPAFLIWFSFLGSDRQASVMDREPGHYPTHWCN